MFDDVSGLENPTEEGQKPSEGEGPPSRPLSVGSIITAGLVYCLLYFPFRNHSWSWPVAVASSYSVLVFVIAFGSGFSDSSDFFGDSRAPKYVATLLLPHALFLVLIMLAAYLWLHLTPILPHWVTVEGRRGSLWELFGVVSVGLAGAREGMWMAGKIKRRLGVSDDSNPRVC